MESLYTQIIHILPILLVVLVIYLLINLQRIAKQGGKIALAFGLFFQMFIPDPKVQHTIEMLAKQKERTVIKKEQQGEQD